MKPSIATSQSSEFTNLGIAPALLQVLNRLSYYTPTPIQRQAIPITIEGKDVVGIAQTGTGKTLAFGIPMIQRLIQMDGRGLVLLPTRELAIQVDGVLQKVGRELGIKTAVLIGGQSMFPQVQALARNPKIIIATPGRLNDHLNQRTVNLGNVKILVLDEADRMLDMGFMPQIQKVLMHLPRERQTMLFSATMPSGIMKIASGYMKLPVRIEVTPQGTTAEKVTQEIFIVGKEAKVRLLDKILSEHHGTTLVFTRTKHGARKLARAIRDMGITSAEIHGNRSLAQRRDALEGFKSGRYRVLVATDIAARGIDVVGIELVVNFDLPTGSEDYVHRIGRTARSGAGGHAISFATPDQRSDIRDIERLIRKSLPVSPLPELPPERPQTYSQSPQFSGRPFGRPFSPRPSQSSPGHFGGSGWRSRGARRTSGGQGNRHRRPRSFSR